MRRLYLILFAVALAVNANGQSSVSLQPHRGPLREYVPAATTRATASVSQPSVPNTSTSLDSFFTAYMATHHIPGVAACIIKKNRVAWEGYYGLADISLNINVTDSTIFMLASLSKTVTTTALMQLYEAGRFQLDDSVDRYVRFEVRNPNHPSVPITFRMLLTHTSSIGDNWAVLSNLYVMGDHPLSLGTFLRRYLLPGERYYSLGNFYRYAPGTTWNYCNVGAALCGYLVERISGIPFDQYCRDSVFVPLRMARTAWFLRDLDTALVARPYTYSSGTYIDQGLYGYPDYPDGQLRTTAASLARFLMANMNGGELDGQKVLDSSTVRLMRTRWFIGGAGGRQEDQGLIWYTATINGKRVWGHTGGDAGVTTAAFLSEQDSTGVLFLSNLSPDDFAWRDIVDRLMTEADTLTVDVRQPVAYGPEEVLLHQNYPNPFNPSTTIRYALPIRSHVVLTIFNMLGERVAELVNREVEAGYHEVQFDGATLASGVYFYRLQAGDFVHSKKLMIVR